MKKLICLISLCVVSLFAKTDSSKTEFSHAGIGIEGGALYFLDDVQDALDNTYYGLLEFEYLYFEKFRGVVQFGYSYLPTKGDVEYPGIHQVNGRVGVDYPLPIAKPIAIGAGFSCVWMRADDDGDVSRSTLEDNETEFGFYARLDLPILKLENWRMGAKFYFETLWTEPETSQTAWFGFYLQRKLW